MKSLMLVVEQLSDKAWLPRFWSKHGAFRQDTEIALGPETQSLKGNLNERAVVNYEHIHRLQSVVNMYTTKIQIKTSSQPPASPPVLLLPSPWERTVFRCLWSALPCASLNMTLCHAA